MNKISTFFEGLMSVFDFNPSTKKLRKDREKYLIYRHYQLLQEQKADNLGIDIYLGNDSSLENSAEFIACLFNKEIEESIKTLPSHKRKIVVKILETSTSDKQQKAYQSSINDTDCRAVMIPSIHGSHSVVKCI